MGNVGETTTSERHSGPAIAVIIPCYNEAVAIGTVVKDFRDALPTATIYVYDNNSDDDTIVAAREAGAIVRSETRQGKGFVVRRMLADIDADIYVMVDGDNTYDATAAPELVQELINHNLDMVSGARVEQHQDAYRPGHRFGNWMLTSLVRWIFGDRFRDMLSGYRVFSRRFVKSFPVMSGGFEIETELTIHALELEMPTSEVDTKYSERDEGSTSKLRTIQDGIRILLTIGYLLKQERPLSLFLVVASAFLMAAASLAVPLFLEFFTSGLVLRLPTATLVMGLSVVGILSIFTGLILDTVTRGRREMKRLRYISLPSVGAHIGLHRVDQSVLPDENGSAAMGRD